MADSPYYWQDNTIRVAVGFHAFTLAYIEPMAGGRALLSIYGWSDRSGHVLPPQSTERPEPDGETDGCVEIPCRDVEEARKVAEALFLVRGWQIRSGGGG